MSLQVKAREPAKAVTKTAAVRRGHSLVARRNRAGYLMSAPALLFLGATMLFPLVYNFWTSVHDVAIGDLITGDWTFSGVDNYDSVVSESAFWHSVRVSLAFTAGSLAFQFTIGFALALLFVRKFPLAGLFRSLMLVAWLLPPIVSGTLFRWMLDADAGAYNELLRAVGLDSLAHNWLTDPSTALPGVIAANIWVGVPFNMLLLLVGLQSIDPTLYEAGAIDGAGPWQRLRHITIPLMRPVSAAVLLLGLIYTFKVFDLVFVLTGGGPVDTTTVLPLYVYQVAFKLFQLGRGAAAGTLLLVIPLLVAIVYVRRLRKEGAAA
ncbi:sugar ABC transporter permease [Streptomyces montanus]|uniref:Sugar ABC transporter permease n=1 Tax=Streptomyces montanus TaxID=2580423 RepID=A0A5R9G4N0_9ACTN|nr:sugar ABC transporter permease [Streptomyces montanus]TLS47874.1 sugar ABC transporter permease [Streptomyces montanus]